MGTQERTTALRTKHLELETKIQDEEQKMLPDDIVIHELKKQKLRIKDELSHLEHR